MDIYNCLSVYGHCSRLLNLPRILLIIIAQDREVRTYNGKDIYRRPKMPAPYSYDLRQKVINAIELDGIP
ncbi:hypothetical protein H4N54_13020, partial [Limnospira fusiformis KN01]|uniref:hypothetical protein n=1 Tax=Limnospira fusiformis TaxID=54297 RepID=UPI001CA643CE